MKTSILSTATLRQATLVMEGLQLSYPEYVFSVTARSVSAVIEMEKIDQNRETIYGIQQYARGYYAALKAHCPVS